MVHGILFALSLLPIATLQSSQSPQNQNGFFKYAVDGPSRLSKGELNVISKVKANLESQGSTYKITVGAASGQSYDIQLLFPVPYPDLTSNRLANRVQIDFEVRADKPLEGLVIKDITSKEDKHGTGGLTFSVDNEWKKYSFQLQPVELRDSASRYFFPAMRFTSIPGEIEVRRIFLRNMSPTLIDIPLVAAPKSEADVFKYLANLPALFDSRDLAQIVGAWSPEFTETGGVSDANDTQKKVSREDVVKMWAGQISYNGSYAKGNGPSEVLLDSMVLKGAKLTVTGYWNGSWRLGDWNNLREGGVSFENKFITYWSKTASGWQLDSFSHGKYVEISDSELKALKAAHKKLEMKYSQSK